MYEVEIMQIFETMDNMERNMDAPSYLFDIIREDLDNALFAYCECYRDYTPSKLLDVYMDAMGEYALMAKTEASRMRFTSIANLTKKLKEFYIIDLFDKNINHPMDEEEQDAIELAFFEKYDI